MTTCTGLVPVFTPPGYRDYGPKEFSCRDRDGNRLNFSTPLEG